ncbi:hypothetical protein H6P81_015200 [Aristolochia fimbriata]|uniref:FMN-binding split barrel n=1 Tax=Aristolochia fimbriata TaxID=158543 RepID=A0AAV7E6V7_ARIFI|nr:hypothetical protein H6P81_015200 [Aristolochia fimbriata]
MKCTLTLANSGKAPKASRPHTSSNFKRGCDSVKRFGIRREKKNKRMIELALAVGSRTGWFSSCSFCVSSCCLSWSVPASDDLPVVSRSRPFNRKGISVFDSLWKNGRMSRGFSFTGGYHHHRYSHHNVPAVRVRVASDYSDSESKESNDAPYHPFEELTERILPGKFEESAKLSDAEMSRTIVEANSKATLMFSGAVGDEDTQSIFWPELSYITDEHGDLYFEVQNDEDILRSLSAENNSVQVIIGLNNLELLSELDLSGQTDLDFNIEEITDENNDDDDDEDNDLQDEDYVEDWITILDDLDDGFDSSETLGDWANLETMRSSHPMYFASKIVEAVSNLQLDWMDQPSTVVAIQGLLRPAFIEEQTIIREYIRRNQSHVDGKREVELDSNTETSSKDGGEFREDDTHVTGSSFYKLEMTKIQLVSAYGSQASVRLEDFRKARPDIIAHSAAKIMSNLKAGGDKTTQALKSLCWRRKGIQVQEATVIGVDSLGFDLKVCAATQVQTLRFAFHSRATSEYSAQRLLEEMLFPEE